ncbi:MAG: ribonuclease P protein component [Pseudomonadota bacterium]
MTGSSTYRFQKANRLLDAAAFSRVFKKAKRSKDKWFTVLCRENDDDIGRLGLAISKKHCKAASNRNRIKRLVRESFRLHQADLAGLDVVVINQSGAASGTNRQLSDSLHGHWQRCTGQRPAKKNQQEGQ